MNTQPTLATDTLHHHLRKMTGRNTAQVHRAATPLELLYDLTLVVAFGVAGSQLAHTLAAGHVAVAIAGFIFAMFGGIWAWINYTWFASAYDTDDWFMRVAAMVQMAGVLILALGIPALFHGLEDGWQNHNEIMVAGYVVMRLALVALWLRAARDDKKRRKTCIKYAIGIALAQVGWIVLALLHLPFVGTLTFTFLLIIVELSVPYIVENKHEPTPWHPHHIAERYGLLTIIALGEGIIGTTSALEALIDVQGWSVEVALVLAAGLSLTVGCWWMYFNLPFGELLEKNRKKAFLFGYGHIFLYTSIAAIGAGLHVTAYAFQGETQISDVGVVLSVAIPTGLYIAIGYALSPLLRAATFTSLHTQLLVLTAMLLSAAVVMVALGVGIGWSLLVVMLAPWISVLGHEMRGYRQMAEV